MIATSNELIDLLRKSNLLRAKQMSEAAVAARTEPDPNVLAQTLVERGVISSWEAQNLLAGRSSFFVGKYRLIGELGRGGMGAVFKAVEHSNLGRTVAIKVMSPKLLDNPESVKRFLREVEAASALDHPSFEPRQQSSRRIARFAL